MRKYPIIGIDPGFVVIDNDFGDDFHYRIMISREMYEFTKYHNFYGISTV